MNHEEDYNVEGYEHAFSNEPIFQDYDHQQGGHGGAQPQGHGAYQEEEADEYEDDADENFPEPAKKEKKDVSKGAKIGLAALAAVVVAGAGAYFVFPDQVMDLPNSLMSMVTGGDDSTAEPAPEPSVDKPHRRHPAAAAQTAEKPPADGDGAAPQPAPHHTHGKPAAKPVLPAVKTADAETAEKPAEQPKPDSAEFKAPPKPKHVVKKAPIVAAAPKAKPPAHKPAPKVAEVAHAAGGPSTSVSFASGSYWVAASEIERLWSYSSHLKANAGQLTVESWQAPGEGAELSRKRADRVAELLSKNTAPHAYHVTVKVHGPSATKSNRKVNVSFSSKL